MALNPSAPHTEVVETINELTTIGYPEQTQVMEDLRQHGLFTSPDINVVNQQLEVRNAIAGIVGRPVLNPAVSTELQQLHDGLHNLILTKTSELAGGPTPSPTPGPTPAPRARRRRAPGAAPAGPTPGPAAGPAVAPAAAPAAAAAAPATPPPAPPVDEIIQRSLKNRGILRAGNNPAVIAARNYLNSLNATELADVYSRLNSINAPNTVQTLTRKYASGHTFPDITLTNTAASTPGGATGSTTFPGITLEAPANKDAVKRNLALLAPEIERLEAQAEILKETLATSFNQRTLSPAEARSKQELIANRTNLVNGKLALKQALDEMKQIEPYIGLEQLEPRQLLLRILQVHEESRGSTTMDIAALSADAETRIAAAEAGLTVTPSRANEALSYLKPTLKGTLKALIEKKSETEPAAVNMTEQEIKDMLKYSKESTPANREPLKKWLDRMGPEAKTKIPALMAYLKMAIAGGHLNALSRNDAQTLLNNLRIVRNEIIQESDAVLDKTNDKERMLAYLQEINAWDALEKKTNNDKILKTLVTDSYSKKALIGVLGGAGLTVGAGVVGSSVGFLAAIKAVGGFLGWTNLGVVGATAGAHAAVNKYQPEAKKHMHWVERSAGAFFGTALGGPIGAAIGIMGAPSAIKHAKIGWEKHKGKLLPLSGKLGKGVLVGTGAVMAGLWARARGKKSVPKPSATESVA